MELRNYTPFAPLVFTAEDDAATDMGVLVVRGTFRVVPDAALRPDPDQAPVRVADVYRGDPTASSVRWEGDLAPLKPRADVHLDAVAHAPDGEPAPSWTVGVRVGRRNDQGDPVRLVDAALRVTGRRVWRRGALGWRLDPPAPALAVPLVYERAYGGAFPDPDDPDQTVEYRPNPVGTGFFRPKRTEDVEVPAPQIEWARSPIEGPDEEYEPAGVGPLARSWQPRLGLAGTFDEAWRQERWPHLPADFDFAHYNSAPPPLQAPGPLVGDETITVRGLHRDVPEVSVCLPGYTLAGLLRLQDGTLTALPLRIDTVELDLSDPDPDQHRAALVWRTVFPQRKPLRVVEVRMDLPKHAPTPDPAFSSHAPVPIHG
ncbi:DUF2169 family type VI secretion system accessory protein [Rubrivirga sp.]|uniref:DUF2169 family type VI secretion system accessory protein n=1 Tax=Rubrivirga sp. TaxID=1885344 RepID=UPI003B52DC64